MDSGTSTVIDARATTFSGLTCAGRFEVPWHQRRYDWAPEHVDDLMTDLGDAITAERRCYFLGTIILVKSFTPPPPPRNNGETAGSNFAGAHIWRINDGQQRLVTLSLICACLLRTFDDPDDSDRVRLGRRVLFDVDETDDGWPAAANGLTPRLTPPRDDRTRYNLLLQGRNVQAGSKLTSAWRRIDHFVSGLTLAASRRLFDFLMKSVELACLDIPDAVDPNAVFETINCRGKPLDDLDLLRNHLYSWFNDEADADRRASVHDHLENTRAQLRADARFADYARCYFQFRYGFLRRGAFYREARSRIQQQAGSRSNAACVHDLVVDMARPERVDLYRVIASPTRGNPFIDAFVASSGHADNARNLSTLLLELRDYTVTRPLVFALLYRYVSELEPRRRANLAGWIHARVTNLTSFVMRTAFVTPKFEPSHVEREFSEAARRIGAAENAAALQALDIDASLKRCDAHGVLDDATFTARMQSIEMRDAAKTKRLLLGVNQTLDPDGEWLTDTRCSVEHILPRTPHHWPGWRGFNRTAPEIWIHRLGNLTLFDRQDRRPADAERDYFTSKQPSYAQSSIALTRDVARYENWSPANITRRQKRLAKLATQVWSFEGGLG